MREVASSSPSESTAYTPPTQHQPTSAGPYALTSENLTALQRTIRVRQRRTRSRRALRTPSSSSNASSDDEDQSVSARDTESYHRVGSADLPSGGGSQGSTYHMVVGEAADYNEHGVYRYARQHGRQGVEHRWGVYRPGDQPRHMPAHVEGLRGVCGAGSIREESSSEDELRQAAPRGTWPGQYRRTWGRTWAPPGHRDNRPALGYAVDAPSHLTTSTTGYGPGDFAALRALGQLRSTRSNGMSFFSGRPAFSRATLTDMTPVATDSSYVLANAQGAYDSDTSDDTQ